ncbi:MAG: T9SS type A sorting domain-containing protein [Bacteroidia bacterium]
MSIRCFLFFLAALSLPLTALHTHAQCYGNPQAESQVCAGTPVSHTAYTTCPNCTHTWSGSPIAGQGTPTATYIHTGLGDGHNSVYPQVNSYNPNANCYFYDVFQTTVGKQPTYPMPTLSNGPWDGDTGKVWVYVRNRTSMWSNFSYRYRPTWTVSGGTLIDSVTHPFMGGQMFEDTVWVKWTGSGPAILNEARNTAHYGTWGYPFNCNWAALQSSPGYPPMNIFHPSVCQGASTNFYTYPFAGSTFTWSTTNGTVVSGQGTNSAHIVMNGPGTVSLQRDSSGVLSSTNTSITPFVPVINLGPDRSICQTTTTTLTANPGFTGYLWSNGATTQSITVGSAGTYSVTGTVNGNCSASDTIVISVTPSTAPNLGPDVHTCTFPVSLNAGPGYTAYAWSNGANTQIIAAPIQGTYRVTVTDANGCQRSDTVVVFTHQPTVNLGNNVDFCMPGTYTLGAATTQVTNYLWSTGATTNSIQVTGLGSQTYWLQGSNSYGCTAADTITVTGHARPTPNLGPDQIVCSGTTVTFNAGPGYTSYFWQPNLATTQSITVSTPNTYRVTVTDVFNCSGADTVVLSNYPDVPVNLGPDVNVCQPSAVISAGNAYSTYTWSTGATTSSITVTTPGSYSVTTTSPNGCVTSDAINVLFTNFSFSLGNDTTICAPGTITLDPQLLGNFTYNWSTGATSPTIHLSSPANYNVILNVANTYGCSGSDTILVNLLPTPPSLLGADTVLCADTSFTMNVGPGFASYLWSSGATTQSITISSGGVYHVTATAPNGCMRLDTVMVTDLIDCVFPGDVDYDGTADLMDVLALGTGIGLSGPIRNNASLQWYGQVAQSWGGSIATGSNYKQGDTDGNGAINVNDTLAIHNNFGSTHSKTGTVTGTGGRLRIVPINSQVMAGDTAFFAAFYEGDNATTIDSIHGLAVEMNWPVLGNTRLLYIDYGMAWFAPTGNRIDFTRPGGNSVKLAITRTSNTDTSGQGVAMVLAYLTDSNLTQTTPFGPTVTSVVGVGTSLTPRPAQPVSVPVSIQATPIGMPKVVAHVRIGPVPAHDRLNILLVDGNPPRQVRLTNMLGQTVANQPWPGGDECSIDVSGLPAGHYCLQVQMEDGLIVKQVMVGR